MTVPKPIVDFGTCRGWYRGEGQTVNARFFNLDAAVGSWAREIDIRFGAERLAWSVVGVGCIRV